MSINLKEEFYTSIAKISTLTSLYLEIMYSKKTFFIIFQQQKTTKSIDEK